MKVQFEKWHGSGNDFIMIDDRDGKLTRNISTIVDICSRHTGIGSDGIIFIEKGDDFKMDFFNPDGSQSFCGNGSRCAYAFYCSLVDSRAPRNFMAIDGAHAAQWVDARVRVHMRGVNKFERINEHVDLLDTGSPHLVVWTDDPDQLELVKEAHKLRYSERFEKEGINVNFVAAKDGVLHMRTYERGVEAETLSCGTGVTAAALSAIWRGLASENCELRTRGGALRVEVGAFEDGAAEQIYLHGPVQKVFEGTIDLQ